MIDAILVHTHSAKSGIYHILPHRPRLLLSLLILLLILLICQPCINLLSLLLPYATHSYPMVSPHLIHSTLVRRDLPGRLPPCPSHHHHQQHYSIPKSPGDTHNPSACEALHRTAIIVPYRNRIDQLSTFIHHMHPFLQAQSIEYQIVVVEQSHGKPFNRAMLFNIGFDALRRITLGSATFGTAATDCLIFHDVDLLPENKENIYACSHEPRHLSSSIDAFRYLLPYPTLFGGVVSMTSSQFQSVNGFSNRFYGWGGEDDDMYERVTARGLEVVRWDQKVARYRMVRHGKAKPSENRYDVLKAGVGRMESDGLNNLHYNLIDVKIRDNYTWIYVDI